MSVYDINYFPAAPSAGAQNPAAAYFQQNPMAANSGIGAVLTAPGVQAPGTSAGTPLGMNLGTANLALGGIGTLGNLWAAFNAQKLAKEQFQYQKGITDTNLANQIQSYNTALVDRIKARASVTGAGESEVNQYIADNSLRDQRKG